LEESSARGAQGGEQGDLGPRGRASCVEPLGVGREVGRGEESGKTPAEEECEEGLWKRNEKLVGAEEKRI
jgi:hypothetical protein